MLCLLAIVIGLLWAAGVRQAGLRRPVRARPRRHRPAGRRGVGRRRLGHGGRRELPAGPPPDVHQPAARDCTTDACYQAVQARYAIDNGGWFGVGLGKSRAQVGLAARGATTTSSSRSSPRSWASSAASSCWPCSAVLAYTGLRIARRVDDPFRRLAAAAVTTWLVSQALINIGGVVGLLPITGLPLPFISDGGSALVVTLAAVGMLASFARAEPDAARALHARPPARWVRLLWAPLPPLPAGAPPARRRCRGRAPAASGAATRPHARRPRPAARVRRARGDGDGSAAVGRAGRRRHGWAHLPAARLRRLPAPARPARPDHLPGHAQGAGERADPAGRLRPAATSRPTSCPGRST